MFLATFNYVCEDTRKTMRSMRLVEADTPEAAKLLLEKVFMKDHKSSFYARPGIFNIEIHETITIDTIPGFYDNI